LIFNIFIKLDFSFVFGLNLKKIGFGSELTKTRKEQLYGQTHQSLFSICHKYNAKMVLLYGKTCPDSAKRILLFNIICLIIYIFNRKLMKITCEKLIF